MEPSLKAINLIKQCEQFRSAPYICPAGKATIGYGTIRYPSGTSVTMQDNHISQEQATSFLMHDLKNIANDIGKVVKSIINQSQFDALCSFVYNLGITNLKNSTLLKRVNVNPHDRTINEEFNKWVYATVDGEKQKLKGLVLRRQLESDLYFS